VHRRRPAAGHADAVARQRAARADGAVRGQGRDDQAGDPQPALRADDRVPGEHLDAAGAQPRRVLGAIGLEPRVDEGDGDPRRVQVGGDRVGGGARRRDHDPAARRDAVAVDEDAQALGQHDARPVVVGEDERALVRAGGEDDLAGAHLPEPLAGQIVRRAGPAEMVGDALHQGDVVVIVVAEGGGARQDDDGLEPVELGQRLGEPFLSRLTIDLGRYVVQERAARLGLLVGEHHPLAGARGGERRGEAGGAGADDQHVAMGMAMCVAVRVRVLRRDAEAGGGADDRLIDPVPEGARPHEGLVVEARDEDRREQVVHRPDIDVQRRPAVLRADDEPVHALHHRGAIVRVDAARAAIHREERVRLVRSGGQQAAGAVILERAAHQVDAVGDERRRDRVAGIALVGLAVEGERQRAGAVDATAAGQAIGLTGAHRAPSSRTGRGAPAG
jgi:hypothetical protein